MAGLVDRGMNKPLSPSTAHRPPYSRRNAASPDPPGVPVTTRTSESAVRHGGGGREREAWRVTWLLLVFLLINFADKAVLGLVAVPLQADLHLDDSKFGLIGSTFYVLFAVSALLVSRLTRRFRTPVLLLLLVLGVVWALCQVPVVFGLGFAGLVATRMVLGAAEGPAYPVANHSSPDT